MAAIGLLLMNVDEGAADDHILFTQMHKMK